MAHTAYVYRTDSGQYPEYVGRVEFEAALQPEVINSFVHRRERHVIHIDRIEPADWKPGDETIPAVYGRSFSAPEPAQPLHKLEPRRRSLNKERR